MIQQSTGRGDQDIDATSQVTNLRCNIDTPKNRNGANADVFPILADTFFDLSGQLTGRGENQRSDMGPTHDAVVGLLGRKPLQNR